MTLRDYQKTCLQSIRAHFLTGTHRLVATMATGLGKTVAFAKLPETLPELGGKMLILAHREELLDQAAGKVRQANPDLIVGIEQADRRAGSMVDVVVASVQSLSQQRRLARYRPDDFDKIIVDECHHAARGRVTYDRVLEAFHSKGKLLVGWTATVRRGDNIGLEGTFDRIAYSYGLRQAIRDGWLVPLKAYRIPTHTDISDLKMSHGDFPESQLAERVNIRERNDLVVASYIEFAMGRRTLVFCVNVAHSEDLAECFRQHGVRAETIVGATPKDERRWLVSGYRAGDFPVLTGCQVFSEGWDVPEVACIIMARPTHSGLLFTQCLGRGTRPVGLDVHLTDNRSSCERVELISASQKPDCIVIDLVDNAGRHAASLASVPSLVGLPAQFDTAGASITDVAEELDRMREQQPTLRLELAASLSDARRMLREIDLWREPAADDLPAAIRASELAWLGAGGHWVLSLGDGVSIALDENVLGHWDVYDRIDYRGESVVNVVGSGEFRDLAAAVRHAEDYIRDTKPGSLVLVAKAARWRKDPATEKQIGFLRSLGVRVPDGQISKGEAARMISLRLAASRR